MKRSTYTPMPEVSSSPTQKSNAAVTRKIIKSFTQDKMNISPSKLTEPTKSGPMVRPLIARPSTAVASSKKVTFSTPTEDSSTLWDKCPEKLPPDPEVSCISSPTFIPKRGPLLPPTLVRQQQSLMSKGGVLSKPVNVKGSFPTSTNAADFATLGRSTASNRCKTADKKPCTPINPTLLLNNMRNGFRNYRFQIAVGLEKKTSGEVTVKKRKVNRKFTTPKEALANARKEIDMVALLDSCTSYENSPIWLCFRLWDYDENLAQLKKFIKLDSTECRGDEIADMKKIFDFHGMSSCLDCFMLDEECNMRNIGYIIDDDVLISFNNILPYMTQYFADFRDRFYGKSPAQNAQIRQWINYCVRNIRGRRVSEYMWYEMDVHLGVDGFFAGTYRTMADTLMYVSLYNRIKRWEPEDFAKRYNFARWFRLMQLDDKLRGKNKLIEISRSSKYHPNYPYDGIQPDIVDLKIAMK